MSNSHWILGDWGTTALRLHLVRHDGKVIEQMQGPGVSKMQLDAEQTFFKLCQPWIEQYAVNRVVLSGMVGSALGWALIKHVACPVSVQEIIAHTQTFECRKQVITLVPGLSCKNALGYHDVMRGEEVQLLGAMLADPGLKVGQQLICLPGTHSKWVHVLNGEIIDFISIPTGELFELIRSNSTLVPHDVDADSTVNPAFLHAVQSTKQHPMLVQLFQVRSRALNGELSPSQQVECLSGLLIGEEIKSVLHVYGQQMVASPSITIIASNHLAKRYQAAFESLGYSARLLDGDVQSLSGLAFIAKQLEASAVPV
ncbi:MAG: 2-dehydro-3-deoxygalactonokinase [Arenimonas sp.]|nr:2-dehydro-3-deoxygalactonokinase [Arenimonas sp.]